MSLVHLMKNEKSVNVLPLENLFTIKLIVLATFFKIGFETQTANFVVSSHFVMLDEIYPVLKSSIYYTSIHFFNETFSQVFQNKKIIICSHRKYGDEGLPDKSISIEVKGHGGQSFCAFLSRGIHVELEGDSNDYVGKVSLSLLISLLT